MLLIRPLLLVLILPVLPVLLILPEGKFMSACQKGSVSCFACCGLSNLNLSPAEQKDILKQRTEEFAALNTEKQFPEYRKHREDLEAGIPRHDPEIYVCPFLGYIAPARAGCLIHPQRTGNPLSQNYSFYGASICLNYDCRAKEKEELRGSMYSDFLEREFAGAYHRLICDSALFSLLESIPDFPDSVIEGNSESLKGFLLLRCRHPDHFRITSFERLMVRSLDVALAMQELFLPEDRSSARELFEFMHSRALSWRNRQNQLSR